jgi:A/G-specific adenine glycosylase
MRALQRPRSRPTPASVLLGHQTGTSIRAPPGIGTVDAVTTAELPVGDLLTFFARQGRDLPWRRRSAGAWGVLVSEVMLQQTPVSRVLDVYLQWLARWPTPAALAADSPGDAVRAWGRLGYPRRALRLHSAAVAIENRHAGKVPEDLDELLALPGVGEYTARAVAAFAFGARVPVVDTNVRRVLNRLVRGVDDGGPATAADRAFLADLLPGDPATAAHLSAALMEFGALVCAAKPRCDDCPMRAHCRWLAGGRPAAAVTRRPQAWHGTDRQVRGRIMAVLRESPGPVPIAALDAVWPDADQRGRCLDSLLTDGLAVRPDHESVALPGQ